jgi:hypothetical protein
MQSGQANGLRAPEHRDIGHRAALQEPAITGVMQKRRHFKSRAPCSTREFVMHGLVVRGIRLASIAARKTWMAGTSAVMKKRNVSWRWTID